MTKRTFMIGIPTQFDTYEEWITDHDSKVIAGEKQKIISLLREMIDDGVQRPRLENVIKQIEELE